MTGLRVLLQDNHLLVVNKPAGVPVVPDESGDESLLDLSKAWVKEEFEKPGRVFLGVVHRLDRPVSGVVLFARTSKAAGRLSDQWRERAVEKRYLGVTASAPPGEDGIIEQWLLKDSERNQVCVVDPPAAEARSRARLARTRWRLLDRDRGLSFLELEPLTGRSHQLRVAMQSLGCPLLGDLKYGAPQALPDRSVALHARRLGFLHPTRDETVRVEAPLPEGGWWNWKDF